MLMSSRLSAPSRLHCSMLGPSLSTPVVLQEAFGKYAKPRQYCKFHRSRRVLRYRGLG